MQHRRNDRDAVTVTPGTSLRDAARLMRDRGIGCVVVVDPDGRLAGILTDRDLCLRAAAFERDPETTTVGAVMTQDVRGASCDAPREAWAAPMQRLGVRRVPVLDAERRPRALYSADDWLRWLAARLVDVAATADPAQRHGALHPPAFLLDQLTQHIESRALLDREELLAAIERLRGAVE